MVPLFFAPLADFKTVTAPSASLDPSGRIAELWQIVSETGAFALLVGVGLGLVWLVLRARRRRDDAPGKGLTRDWILVDGSNVMHWQDNTPRLAPLVQVVERLQALG